MSRGSSVSAIISVFLLIAVSLLLASAALAPLAEGAPSEYGAAAPVAAPQTDTPTSTATSTNTAAPTATATSTAKPTATNTPTDVPTPTGTASPTATLSATASASPTATAENTASATPTGTAQPAKTASPTATAENTAAPTETEAPTSTATATATPTPTLDSSKPANDEIDAATVIKSFPYTVTQDISNATSAPDDPSMGNGLGANSNTVWYHLLAPGSGSVSASTSGSSYDTVLAAFTGSRGSLSLAASNDDANSSTYQSEVTFNVQPGTTYYIEVAQYGKPYGGTLQLKVDYNSSPVSVATSTPTPTVDSSKLANDEIDAAALIESFPYTATQDISSATVASDDPDMEAGAGVNANTVWFTFVAPSGGGLHAYTTGSDYDTVLAAFTGTRGNLTVVAANDDITSGVVTQSEVRFNLQSGQTYYLEVAQYGAPGIGQLKLTVELGDSFSPTAEPTATPNYYWYATSTPEPTATLGPAPSNDDIGAAIPIESFPFTDSRDTFWATVASDDPSMGSDLGVNSNTVWYRLVAPSNGSVQADTNGSDYDTVLAAFTGTRGNLSLVASNDDITTGIVQQSEMDFNVQAGETYYLEVAQYGSPLGGQLELEAFFNGALAASTPMTTLTPSPTAVGSILGSTSAGGIPPSPRTSGSVPRDDRYFSETGYRINLDPFWDYFNKRGGLRTFGYPVSWEFPLLGFQVQFFQRGILQLMPDGSVATMNLLDSGLMPYSSINGSSFPLPEQDLIDSAPSPTDPDYADRAVAFLQANVPDEWEGMPVGFLDTFLSTVRYEDAFPQGEGDQALLPLLNLELWGLPTSRPARDPNNADFVYQRFQRGILHYDASAGTTQGLLLADYLKSIMTGEDLPDDLKLQAEGSPFYQQYDRSKPGSLARPSELPGTNLTGAFDPEIPDQ